MSTFSSGRLIWNESYKDAVVSQNKTTGCELLVFGYRNRTKRSSIVEMI